MLEILLFLTVGSSIAAILIGNYSTIDSDEIINTSTKTRK